MAARCLRPVQRRSRERNTLEVICGLPAPRPLTTLHLPVLRPAFFTSAAPATDKLLHAIAGAVFGAVALLGAWMVGGLLWGFSTATPAPPVRTDGRPQEIADALASRPLFGAGLSTPPIAAESNWRLLGVLAGHDAQAARAILRRDGEPATLVLAVGDDAGGGATLRAIGSDGIVLVAGGRESRLNLPQPVTAAAAETPEED